MKASRREFVATSLAGVAGIYTRQTRPATAGTPPLTDEDGYRLWLRYAPPGDAADAYRSALRTVSVAGASPTTDVIRAELRQALTSMLGAAPPNAMGTASASLLIGTPAQSAAIRALKWDRRADRARTRRLHSSQRRASRVRPAIVVASSDEIGALYGTFHLLRLLQTAQPIARLDIAERPKVQLRMLEPLGQHGRDDRTRLRRPLALELGRAAGNARSALHRLRARQRVARHQRRPSSTASTRTRSC